MKKLFFIFFPIFLICDTIMNETIGCPDLKDLKHILQMQKDNLDINLEIIKRDCRVFNPKEKVQVRLDVPQKDGFVQVYFPKTEEFFYIQKKDIKIEQPGQKNIIRF